MPRPFDRSLAHRAGYLVRILWLPVALLVVALLAYQRGSAADEAVPEQPRVEDPSPATPVLSARRLPATLLHPSRRLEVWNYTSDLYEALPAQSCLHVTDYLGRALIERNPGVPVVPASSQKLVTAQAALNQLGTDYRYRTTLVTDARIDDGVLEGDLWLVGGGDPVLATEAYAASFANQPQIRTPFESLVEGLRQAGVTRVAGSLLADAGRYDDERYVSSWPDRWKTGVGAQPSGPLSALNVNDGMLEFPSEGQEFGGSGTRLAASDPPLATAEQLAALMEGAGITVDGEVASQAAPPAPLLVAAVESPPLSDIVGHMLRESDNTSAELLLKEIAVARGAPGTTADGASAVAAILTDAGLPVEGLVVADGSGLSTDNRATCQLLVWILNGNGPDSTIGQGLPVSAESGTLTDRFIDSPAAGQVRAKTGSLSDVSSLAGFLDTDKGVRLTFAIVLNDPPERGFEAFEEELINRLVGYPELPARAFGPKPVPS